MFYLTDSGSDPVDHPERILAQELPPELREVFFTDGDRALNFIEADTSSKRERVQKAIRSLLGLDVIEDTLGHIRKTAMEVNRKARDVGANDDLDCVTSRLEGTSGEIEKHESTVADAKTQIAEVDPRISETQKLIDDTLIKGDKASLQRELAQLRENRRQIEQKKETVARDHSALFRSFALSRDVLAAPLQVSISTLHSLRNQKQFPKTAIPVLEDRMNAGECICGASLAAHMIQMQRAGELT